MSPLAKKRGGGAGAKGFWGKGLGLMGLVLE